MKLPSIPNDKAQHFVYGCVVALAVLYVGILLGMNWRLAKLLALGAAIAVGVLKEYVFDAKANELSDVAVEVPKHTVSRGDAIATALGGLAIWVA